MKNTANKNNRAKERSRNRGKTTPSNGSKGLIDSLRFSIRINQTSVSSVSLKKNITSLWLLMVSNTISFEKKINRTVVTDFIYKNLDSWTEINPDNAKGFSDFVTERMIEDILDKEDFIEYQKIKDVLS